MSGDPSATELRKARQRLVETLSTQLEVDQSVASKQADAIERLIDAKIDARYDRR